MTIGNNKVTNTVGTNGEATLNSNGRKLIEFCTFNNLKIMKKKLRGLSPRANYTDRAAATGRRS